MTPSARLRRWVTQETTSGLLLLLATAAALIWANSPWRDSYHSLASATFGPSALNLHLDLATWAGDGLLAIFFFVIGLELKTEVVTGSLRNPRKAGVPILAAIGGMAVPAVIYLIVITATGDTGARHGWAIPTATDIAFALAVLSVFGRGLAPAIRTFLLTLAVVDDLLAIIVIAVFYTQSLHWGMFALALVGVAIFAVLIRLRRIHWWLLIPVALATWTLVHASGIHATIAGVLLGLTVPARAIHGEATSRTHSLDLISAPISSGFALPLFAFFSAGVTIVGQNHVLRQAIVPAVVAALVIGKLIGVMGTTALVTRFTPLHLDDGIVLRDLLPIGVLAGIGFTVSLLLAELSFPDAREVEGAKIAVLMASLLASIAGAALLRWDVRRGRTSSAG